MRKFWYFGNTTITVELNWERTRRIGGYIALGGEDNVFTIHGAIPYIIQFWFTLSNFRMRARLRFPYEELQTGWELDWWGDADDDVWLSVFAWHDPMGWSPGWHWMKNLSWLIFGKTEYSEIDRTEWKQIDIPMPEGNYPARIRFHTAQWKQPRKRFVRRVRRADVEILGDGIPHPGKGTTSYNIADDALLGGCYGADTVEQAVKKITESVMYCRNNYPL